MIAIPGFCHSRNSRIFLEKIPEILENVNAINLMKSINGGLHCCSFLAIVTGHLVSWSTSLLAILAVFCYNVAAMAMLFCFHGNCETVKLVLDNIELINNNQCTSECRCLLKIILITGNQLFFSQVKPTCLRGLLFINTVYTHQVLDFASH